MSCELAIKNNTLPALGHLSPLGDIKSYIRFANKVPMLEAEEEFEAARQLKYHNDLKAAQKLIMSHLRFVIKVARSFSGYGLSQADLIQEGNIGLMKAVKRFNPENGVRLVSFAVHWIKAEMHEFVIKNWRIVKVATTKAQRKLFFNLRNSKKRLGWFSEDEINDVAQTLNVEPKVVKEMEQRMSAIDSAYDAPFESDDDQDMLSFSPSHYLASSSDSPEDELNHHDWESHKKDSLSDALSQLDERSQDIVTSRYLADKKATLHELANKYQISAERVRQLEAQAMLTLKDSLKDLIDAA